MSIEDAYIELRKINKLLQETVTKLSKENKKLKEKLEKIRKLVSSYRSCYAEPILEIIEGAEE